MKDMEKMIYEVFEEEIKIPKGLSERLEKNIDEYIESQKLKVGKLKYFRYAGIAASILLCTGLFFTKSFYTSEKPAKDTFKDPAEAQIYAQRTLEFVSANLNKGMLTFEKAKENIDNANKILNNTLTIK